MKKISIVIPAHNEEGNVSLIRQRIADVFSKLEHYKYEIIFVNDGSRDNTQQKLEELAAKFLQIGLLQLQPLTFGGFQLGALLLFSRDLREGRVQLAAQGLDLHVRGAVLGGRGVLRGGLRAVQRRPRRLVRR